MTSRNRPSPAWLVAPLAAGALAVSSGWAQQHDPRSAATAAGRPAQAPAMLRLEQRAQLAAGRLQRSQASLAHLEAAVRQRSARLAVLAADLRAAGGLRAGAPLPAAGAPAPAPAASLPPPVAVPAAPQVNATTGAS